MWMLFDIIQRKGQTRGENYEVIIGRAIIQFNNAQSIHGLCYVYKFSILWTYLFIFVDVHDAALRAAVQAFRREEELQFYRSPKRRRDRFDQVSLLSYLILVLLAF